MPSPKLRLRRIFRANHLREFSFEPAAREERRCRGSIHTNITSLPTIEKLCRRQESARPADDRSPAGVPTTHCTSWLNSTSPPRSCPCPRRPPQCCPTGAGRRRARARSQRLQRATGRDAAGPLRVLRHGPHAAPRRVGSRGGACAGRPQGRRSHSAGQQLRRLPGPGGAGRPVRRIGRTLGGSILSRVWRRTRWTPRHGRRSTAPTRSHCSRASGELTQDVETAESPPRETAISAQFRR